MKVYCFTPNTTYSGGCFIVAANSPEEAFGAIHSEERVLANYTDLNHCEEVKQLIPTLITKPTVILDTLYVE